MFLFRVLILLSCLQPWVYGRKLIPRAEPGSPDAIDRLLDEFPPDPQSPDAIDRLLDKFPLDPIGPDAIDRFPAENPAGEMDQFLAHRPRYELGVLGEGYRRTCHNLPPDPEGCGVLPLPEWTNDQFAGVCHDLQQYVPAVHYPYPRIDDSHPQNTAGTSGWNEQALLAWQRGTLNAAVQGCLEQPPAHPMQAGGSPVEEIIQSCDREPEENEQATTSRVVRSCLMSNDRADSCMVPLPVYDPATDTYKGFYASFENGNPTVPDATSQMTPSGYVLVHWTLAGAWVYTIPGIEIAKYVDGRSRDSQAAADLQYNTIVQAYQNALMQVLNGDLKGVQVRGIVLHANFYEITPNRWRLFTSLLHVFQHHTRQNGYTVDNVGFSLIQRPSSDPHRAVMIQCAHSPNLETFPISTAGTVCDFYSPGKQARIWAFLVEKKLYLGAHRSRTVPGPRKKEMKIEDMQHYNPTGLQQVSTLAKTQFQP